DRVVVAATAIPPPPASTPSTAGGAPATAPLPAPMVGPRARVHITSREDVVLYRRPASSSGGGQACSSPCNEELPIGDTYRITGNGVAATKEFRLETSPSGTVELTVDPPSSGGKVVGGILTATGAIAAYMGLFIGAGRNCGNCNNGNARDT